MEDEKTEKVKPESRVVSFFMKDRTWLNVLLFILTVLATFFVGVTTWAISYLYADVAAHDQSFLIGPEIFLDQKVWLLGLIYTGILLGILLGHEMGHFLTCRRYKIDATLPFFIPAPTLIGTMGAFIKIRSPITKKRQLFDIGVAGPLVGFLLAVPAMIYGLSLSKIVPPVPEEGSIIFGEPLILKIAGGFIFKTVPPNFDIILHPIAFAGWVGILITALNLFPIGQLDGGHIVYALFGEKAKKITRFVIAAYIVMGIFFWVGWFVWALLISVLGTKHPRVIDEDIPLSPSRKWIGFFVLLVFILSFIPDPVKGYSLFELFPQLSF
jgi:hypothetical protein